MHSTETASRTTSETARDLGNIGAGLALAASNLAPLALPCRDVVRRRRRREFGDDGDGDPQGLRGRHRAHGGPKLRPAR